MKTFHVIGAGILVWFIVTLFASGLMMDGYEEGKYKFSTLLKVAIIFGFFPALATVLLFL